MHTRQQLVSTRVLSSGFTSTGALVSVRHPVCHSSTLGVSLEEKRHSRRRYSASNTRGRSTHVKQLIDRLKRQEKLEARQTFDALMPRDKLDILRVLYAKRTKRRQDRHKSKLPRYRSALFDRRYFFREEDLEESSTLGRGPGGQATNRRMQTAIVKHIPSEIVVKFSRFPSLWLNRRAARELMNLRLEDHLLGNESQLGRQRVLKERRCRHREMMLRRMTKKGNALAARDARQTHYYGFLKGQKELPPAAMIQVQRCLGVSSALKVKDLFDKECLMWWPMLQEAFGQSDGSVPLLLQYVFPTAAADDPYALKQLEQCRADHDVQVNVRTALRCFCELFGLRIEEVARKSDGAPRLVIVKDGMNWLEMRRRMVADDGDLTAIARVTWQQVSGSLSCLGLKAEASAVKLFFRREARDGGKWAKEALNAMK